MKIVGKITAVLPLQTGEGKNGTWNKQTAVVEEESGQYPQSLAFDMFQDKIVPLTIGQKVEVDFDTKAREYQGKYFNNVNAWKVTVSGAVANAPVAAPAPAPEATGLPF